MNCPRCSQPTDEGAAYCGNCGQALRATVTPAASLQGQTPATPAYAVARPSQHTGEMKALLSLVAGLAGIVGSLVLPAAGIFLGTVGVVLGTMSRRTMRRWLSTSGIVAASLAILVGLGVWTYVLKHNAHQAVASQAANPDTSSAVAANTVDTPCYSAGFSDQLNIATANNTCNIEAYNGTTLDTSSSAYKVFGYKQPSITPTTFGAIAKQALEKDISDNLPGFTITNEKVGQFAGSPAYFVSASNNSVGYVEAAVLHKSGSRENLFVFVHAVNGKKADLSTMESQWQWK